MARAVAAVSARAAALAWWLFGVASAWLSEESLKGCSFELVTIDDRPLPSSARGVQAGNYWAMTAVLNYAYASHWGYGFRYVQLNSSVMPQYRPTWGKVFYVAERLRGLVSSQQCVWLLCLDGDAFVREFDVPLPVFLAGLGRRYRIRADIGAIFTKEQDLDMGSGLVSSMRGYRPKVPWLNTGVYFIQAGRSGRIFTGAWEDAARSASHFLQNNWPGEQGVVTELVMPGTYPSARVKLARRPMGCVNCTLAVVDLVEFNSPWGRFAAHLWSHHDYLRSAAFWDGLVRLRLNGPRELADVYYKMRNSIEIWGPTAAAIGGQAPAPKPRAAPRRKRA